MLVAKPLAEVELVWASWTVSDGMSIRCGLHHQ
jgi:hypothetical protein